jgi:Uma2 family endonuclease
MSLHEEFDHYTVADYAKWEGDWELIQGRPQAMTPSPGISHQRVSGNLFRQFHEQLERCPHCLVLFDTDWEIAEDTVVRPDIMVLCGEVGGRVTRRPELIAEVVSRATARRDERIKFRLYAEEGVPFYFLVFPGEEKVMAYHLREGEYSKIDDYNQGTWNASIKDCHVDMDFSLIWE